MSAVSSELEIGRSVEIEDDRLVVDGDPNALIWVIVPETTESARTVVCQQLTDSMRRNQDRMATLAAIFGDSSLVGMGSGRA